MELISCVLSVELSSGEESKFFELLESKTESWIWLSVFESVSLTKADSDELLAKFSLSQLFRESEL